MGCEYLIDYGYPVGLLWRISVSISFSAPSVVTFPPLTSESSLIQVDPFTLPRSTRSGLYWTSVSPVRSHSRPVRFPSLQMNLRNESHTPFVGRKRGGGDSWTPFSYPLDNCETLVRSLQGFYSKTDVTVEGKVSWIWIPGRRYRNDGTHSCEDVPS